MGDWGAGCHYLFDISGGGGPSANETTNTASGQGQIFGKGGTNVGSGSINVGPKGKYLEQGSLDQAGQRNNTSYKLGRGATLNITQAAPLNGLGAATQPISALTSTPGTVPTSTSPLPSTTPTPAPAPTTDPNATPSTSWIDSWWASAQSYWTGLSTWQQVAAGIAGVLVLWLIFHRRRA
jgi:hypothetical protein